MITLGVRNVNGALDALMYSLRDNSSKNIWMTRASRNGRVYEATAPVTTVYGAPMERVLFSEKRDANPFFHLFESLWILAGRSDVAFLDYFNSRIREYSDDGKTFHAPYGYRIRRHFRWDQLVDVVRLINEDKHTRRAVISIWDAYKDLGTKSKDIPCNDTLFFKARPVADDGEPLFLDLTVCCRSNDVIWGAYGANAVQFSFILEVVAAATGLQVGTYHQISDSYHVYVDNPAFQRMLNGHDWNADLYARNVVSTYPLRNDISPGEVGVRRFLECVEHFCEEAVMRNSALEYGMSQGFIGKVCVPMLAAWRMYKGGAVRPAYLYLKTQDQSNDWIRVGTQWMQRRAEPCHE